MVRLLRLLASLLLAAACACSQATTSRPSQSSDIASGVIKVFAAASLTTAFKDEGAAFHARHPQASVQFNFGGSTALVTEINQGAPADVFASADVPNMQKLVVAGNASGKPQNFASNKLQIVVRSGNPKGIKGLADLANPATVVVLCAPAVPCGNYANQAFARAGVRVTPKSQEQDVSAVVSKVSLGEADAGIVYVTDTKAAGPKVQGVEIPDDQNVLASYPVAAIKGGSNPAGGQAFIDFLLSTSGQGLLANYGFTKP